MAAETSRLARLRRAGGFYAPKDRLRLCVTGADRVRYLNGQVSNDLRRLTPGVALAALVLTAKGKLCGDVLVWAEGEALIVEADAALGKTLPARLERYAIADDVAFEVLPSTPRRHVFGPAAEGLEGVRISRLGIEGLDVDTPPPGMFEATAEEVEALRIERGVPQWGRELNEDILPQEAGLERAAVDFHKGCYVGQEVVSRIQSVGRVNRLLGGFWGDFPPEKASTLSLAAADGTKAGHLTSAIRHPETGRTAALGYLSTRAEGASFSVIDESGACLGAAERSEFPLVS